MQSGKVSCTIRNPTTVLTTRPPARSHHGHLRWGRRPPARQRLDQRDVADLADSGGFGIGDVSADKPPAPMHPRTKLSNGSQANFWGSQTWKTNESSGLNNVPVSMKGYIDNAPSGLGQPRSQDPRSRGTARREADVEPGNSSNRPRHWGLPRRGGLESNH